MQMEDKNQQIKPLAKLLKLCVLTRRVPFVAAEFPGQHAGDGSEQVVDRPGDDNVVIDAHQPGDHRHADAHA